MKFQEWLHAVGLLTMDEWKQIQIAIIEAAEIVPDPFGFMPGKNFDRLQTRLFGDVLQQAPCFKKICDSLKISTLEQLLEGFWEWHRQNMEPVATYSQANQFGRNIYESVVDKQMVGKFICNDSNTHAKKPQIFETDIVAIPDSSSAFFIGLAVAAFKPGAAALTSNCALIREYRENPRIGWAFSRFHIVGGEADRNPQTGRSDLGGVFGSQARKGYFDGITSKPTATVVIVPVSGLLADRGPFASDGAVRVLRKELIEIATSAKVREIVFVADYRKHLDKYIYGGPVFGPDEWKGLIKEHGNRISVVTTPTPTIQQCYREGLLNYDGNVASRDLRNSGVQGVTFSADDHFYAKAAKELHNLWLPKGQPRFFEVRLKSPSPRGQPVPT